MKIPLWNALRSRGLLAGVLALGLLLGIWLGDLFKGLGWGPGDGTNAERKSSDSGQSSSASPSADEIAETADLVGVREDDLSRPPREETESSSSEGGLLHVLIDDRSYYVVRGKTREPIGLEALVELIGNTEPNEDGMKAIIDQTLDSRATAEVNLDARLQQAGIPKSAVHWVKQRPD